MRTYGLEDESAKAVTQEKRGEVVREVLKLLDTDGSGQVTRDEWMVFCARGGKLPDFGVCDTGLRSITEE